MLFRSFVQAGDDAVPVELQLVQPVVAGRRLVDQRRELVAKAWTDGGTYVDAARDGNGHDSLDAMIATAQGHFPGYRLRLASGIEAHHDYLRFSWTAGGTAEAPLYIKGTDFVVVGGDGRIKSVVGFVDAAPARG